MKPGTLALFLLLALAPASASVIAQVAGETHRTTLQPSAAVRDAEGRTQLRITVWYPAAEGAEAEPLAIGEPGNPMFAVGSVAHEAPIAAAPGGKRRPVILLSHGFGGTARIMGWFGTAMAQAGYVVIAVDHPGNNAMDRMTVPGAILWWERANDLKRALEAVSRDEVLGPHIDPSRVGVSGFSAGGFAALLLGGARFDQDRFMGFCRAHPADGICKPQIEFSVSEADRERALQDPKVRMLADAAGDDYSLPSVKAVFALAPALVQGMPSENLAAMRVPVSILVGEADVVTHPDTNARVAAKLIPGATLETLPHAGHYVFLAACTPEGKAAIPVCAHAGPQAEAHAQAIRQAKELFARGLGVP